MTIWCMRIACWIPKATNTHSECVSLIAFRLQQCLHERTLMSHYSSFPALFIIILVRDCTVVQSYLSISELRVKDRFLKAVNFE